MKKMLRKIAALVGAMAVSAGLIGAATTPAQADGTSHTAGSAKDSSWPY